MVWIEVWGGTLSERLQISFRTWIYLKLLDLKLYWDIQVILIKHGWEVDAMMTNTSSKSGVLHSLFSQTNWEITVNVNGISRETQVLHGSGTDKSWDCSSTCHALRQVLFRCILLCSFAVMIEWHAFLSQILNLLLIRNYLILLCHFPSCKRLFLFPMGKYFELKLAKREEKQRQNIQK